jgi:hypothetical protein
MAAEWWAWTGLPARDRQRQRRETERTREWVWDESGICTAVFYSLTDRKNKRSLQTVSENVSCVKKKCKAICDVLWMHHREYFLFFVRCLPFISPDDREFSVLQW